MEDIFKICRRIQTHPNIILPYLRLYVNLNNEMTGSVNKAFLSFAVKAALSFLPNLAATKRIGFAARLDGRTAK